MEWIISVVVGLVGFCLVMFTVGFIIALVVFVGRKLDNYKVNENVDNAFAALLFILVVVIITSISADIAHKIIYG